MSVFIFLLLSFYESFSSLDYFNLNLQFSKSELDEEADRTLKLNWEGYISHSIVSFAQEEDETLHIELSELEEIVFEIFLLFSLILSRYAELLQESLSNFGEEFAYS